MNPKLNEDSLTTSQVTQDDCVSRSLTLSTEAC